MNQAVAKALFSGLLICISVSNSGATANAGPLDYSGSLDASMLQGLLQSASTGFAHIAVTKDDSLSDENSDWYDVDTPPQGFSSCSISVSKPDNQGTEICDFYHFYNAGLDHSACFQAEGAAEGVLHSTLTGWGFHIPHFPTNVQAGLEAIDPSNSNRDVRVYLSLSHNTCRVNVWVEPGVTANVSFPSSQ
jgi:hypothetical protein